MKKVKSLFLLTFIVLTVAFSGCEAFLEENVPNQLETEKFINNEMEAVQFLYGAYGAVQTTVFGPNMLSVTELVTDNVDFTTNNAARKDLSAFSYDTRNVEIFNLWKNLYTVVAQVNILIEKTSQFPQGVLSSGNLIEAEARFLRAWAYFHLVQIWGDVPLITKAVYSATDPEAKPKRSSVAQVYRQILEDLEFADKALTKDTPIAENTPVKVIVNGDIEMPLQLKRGTVKMLLAKTYLVLKDYDNVLTHVNYLLDNPSIFSLAPQYGYLFDPATQKSADVRKEVLWFMDARDEDVPNTINREMGPAANEKYNGTKYEESVIGKTTGYQNYVPTLDLFLSFDPMDQRFKWMYLMIGRNEAWQDFQSNPPAQLNLRNAKPQIRKGYDPLGIQTRGGYSVPMFRFAEALLIAAEAMNENQNPDQALPYVNRIRVRAGLPELNEGLSESEMRTAIMLERRHEFAHEGPYRLFDLRRTGTCQSVMEAYNKKWQEYNDAGEMTFLAGYDSQYPLREMYLQIPFVPLSKVSFAQKHLLHPIPFTEMFVNENLAPNNPGW